MSSGRLTQLVERKTFVKGLLTGQYTGELNDRESSSHELLYDLTLVKGELFIKEEDITPWQNANEEDLKQHQRLRLSLPSPILSHVKRHDKTETFWLELKASRVLNFQIMNRQVEGHEVYGHLRAFISGYITHEDEVPIEEVPPTLPESVAVEDPIGVRPIRWTDRFRRSVVPRGRYGCLTGRWGAGLAGWGRNRGCAPGCLPFTLGGLFLLPFLFFGFKFFWPILLIALVLWLLSRFIGFTSGRTGCLWPVLGLLFALLFLSQVLSWLRGVLVPGPIPQDTTVVETETNGSTEEDQIQDEFLVTGKYQRHHLKWEDYRQRDFEGDIYVRIRDWMEAKNFRNNLPIEVTTPQAYDQMMARLYDFNANGLDGVYALFDSLRTAQGMSDPRFAEVIVSCVQHIPYTLVMDYSCNADDYRNQPMIYDYLSTEGRCIDQVRYGIYGPIEFVASLYGDCDTRTLLLFTLLKHYGYGVVVLSSQALGHSILGIDLPYKGASKIFRGRRYVFWETTATGMRPGEFPAHASNPDYWHVTLL